MISDPNIVVCIAQSKYNRAFKESGFKDTLTFDPSIGLCNKINISMHKHYNHRKPYVIIGGIPFGNYFEFYVLDKRLFEYSKLKYELYND